MLSRSRIVVAAGLGLAVSFATSAGAETRYLGAYGPVVLPVDPGTGRPLGPEPAVARAVPVPSVMNGAGFGPTGNGYYADGANEGPLNGRRHVNEFVLAPARVGPPSGRP